MITGRKWLQSTEHIEFQVADRCARIALNRPEKRNALNRAMIAELHAALLEADDRTDVNVILIEGRGRDFCAGYDLSDSYAGAAATGTYDASQYRTGAGTLDDDCWQQRRSHRHDRRRGKSRGYLPRSKALGKFEQCRARQA